MISDENGDEVGYGHPPKATRFQKGQSGNAKGRPPGRKKSSQIPYDTVLGQLVTINESGQERRVTAAEAFLLHLAKEGLKGRASASKRALQAIHQGRTTVRSQHRNSSPIIRIVLVTPGNPNLALVTLKMGRKLDALRPTARMMLEPWLVEAALTRLGDRRLTMEQQNKVFSATRTPNKVSWPDWWQVKN